MHHTQASFQAEPTRRGGVDFAILQHPGRPGTRESRPANGFGAEYPDPVNPRRNGTNGAA
jgi:hypothetical protein